MAKFEIKVMERDSDKKPWWEDYDVKGIKDHKQALAYGEEVVAEFNDSLRKGEKPRVALAAKLGHTNVQKQIAGGRV